MDLMIEDIATSLHRAERDCVPLPPLSETYPSLTPAQSYAIQSTWLDLKRREGAHLVGYKIGLTNKTIQNRLGIDQPDYGLLLDTMVVQAGSTVAYKAFIQPRIEPEIAFWLAEDVHGPGVTTEQVLAATLGVSAALELVDSRIANWRIKLVDTIADNASSARAVVSTKMVSLNELDLAAAEVILTCNGEPVGSGTGAAVLGHPAAAVAWLANKLAESGINLRKDQIILPGAMCVAVPIVPLKTYQAVFSRLGQVSVSFE
jgi:2-keto-4-pentenoate hydratase